MISLISLNSITLTLFRTRITFSPTIATISNNMSSGIFRQGTHIIKLLQSQVEFKQSSSQCNVRICIVIDDSRISLIGRLFGKVNGSQIRIGFFNQSFGFATQSLFEFSVTQFGIVYVKTFSEHLI